MKKRVQNKSETAGLQQGTELFCSYANLRWTLIQTTKKFLWINGKGLSRWNKNDAGGELNQKGIENKRILKIGEKVTESKEERKKNKVTANRRNGKEIKEEKIKRNPVNWRW